MASDPILFGAFSFLRDAAQDVATAIKIVPASHPHSLELTRIRERILKLAGHFENEGLGLDTGRTAVLKEERAEHLRHPSYGMVQFSRVTNSSGPGKGVRLFGSALADHHTLMRLQVRHAKLEHDLQRDRVFTDGMMPIVEVDMSAAQFAELITTANHGAGAPCTIRYADGARVDEPPDIETEAERIRTNFTDTLDEYIAKADRYRKDIEAIVEKLPEKKRQQIKIALNVIADQLSSNVPFVVEQFNAATDRITSAAKAEVEAFTMHAVTTAGIAALSEQREAHRSLTLSDAIAEQDLLGGPEPCAIRPDRGTTRAETSLPCPVTSDPEKR